MYEGTGWGDRAGVPDGTVGKSFFLLQWEMLTYFECLSEEFYRWIRLLLASFEALHSSGSGTIRLDLIFLKQLS